MQKAEKVQALCGEAHTTTGLCCYPDTRSMLAASRHSAPPALAVCGRVDDMGRMVMSADFATSESRRTVGGSANDINGCKRVYVWHSHTTTHMHNSTTTHPSPTSTLLPLPAVLGLPSVTGGGPLPGISWLSRRRAASNAT